MSRTTKVKCMCCVLILDTWDCLFLRAHYLIVTFTCWLTSGSILFKCSYLGKTLLFLELL